MADDYAFPQAMVRGLGSVPQGVGGPPVVAVGGADSPVVVGISFSTSGKFTQHTALVNGAFLSMPMPVTAPPPGVPTWQTAPGQGQFCWVYNSLGVKRPITIPSGVTLPGMWGLVRAHYWAWYPLPAKKLALVNGFYVLSNADQILGIGTSSLSKPTAPPSQLAHVTGQWINTNPGYWVFVPYGLWENSYA